MRADWIDTEIAQFFRAHGALRNTLQHRLRLSGLEGIALSEILSTSSVLAAFNDAAPASK